jgi:spore germination protein GerM
MSARWANVLTALGLLALFLGVTLSAPRWAPRLRRPLSAPAEEAPRGEESPSPPAPESTEAVRKISVKLLFEAEDQPGLVIEERTVAASQDLATQIRAVLEELIRGSQQSLVPPLDPQTKVLGVFVTARGVAYVDLSKEAAQATGGSEEELLTVYSVVDSITVNFPAVRKVQILIDDRSSDTLGGHVDLSRPLVPDLSLLAALPARPVPSGPPAADASPPPEKGP